MSFFSEGSTYNAAPTDAYDPYYDNFEDPINYYDDNPYPDYDPHYDYDTFDYPEDIYSNVPDVYGAGVTEEYLGAFLPLFDTECKKRLRRPVPKLF